MKIIVGKYSGFCNGVKYTLDKTNEVLSNDKNVYSLGDIVHNEIVISKLKENGLIVKDDISLIPNNSKVIIRAHGEGIETYNIAKEKNLELIDLTCGKVKIIHNKILNKRDDNFIIVIGKKTHPETIAHATYSENIFVVENIEDISLCYKKYLESKLNKVYIVAQTTFNENKFDILCNEIRKVFFNVDVFIDKTICSTTKLRQNETKEISSKVNKMIIVGGKNSSNTKELANIASIYCKDVLLIETYHDLKDYLFKDNDTIGIEGGASTPKNLIDEIVNYLNNIYKTNDK